MRKLWWLPLLCCVIMLSLCACRAPASPPSEGSVGGGASISSPDDPLPPPGASSHGSASLPEVPGPSQPEPPPEQPDLPPEGPDTPPEGPDVPPDSSQTDRPEGSQPASGGSRAVPEPPPQSPQEPAEVSPPPEEPPAPSPANHTLYILMYHSVVEGDGSDCNDWTVTTQRLREDLQWLKDHGYTTLLPSELAEEGAALPERAVLITFDDGYADNYTLAYPLLQEFQAKAVISLIARRMEDGVDGFLTWDMCREMAGSGLVEFGSHTYDSHRSDPRGIRRMDGERREDYEARIFPDLEESIQLIEENTGQTVRFFAYPHGQTEPWASDFLSQHFAVTVTTQHGPADLSGGLYDLPRHNINVRQTASQYLPD